MIYIRNMQIGLKFFTVFIYGVFVANASYGYDVIKIGNGEIVDVANLNIQNATVIVNHGHLYGALDSCDGCDIYIQNFGTADDVNLGAHVTQVVTGNDNMNPVGGASEILVYDAEKLSVSDLAELANGVQSVTINGAGLVLDGETPLKNVTLQGNVILYVDDVADVSNMVVASGVSVDGMVHVSGVNINPLYRFGTRIEGGNLYVDFVRDTDYSKILGDKLGGFLDELRVKNSDDRLLAALDGAASVDEIHSIMSRSVRVAPMQLMDIVRVMNVNEISRVRVRGDSMSLIPMAMFADNASAMGGAIDRNYGVGSKITLGISGYVYAMSYGDDFDEYESALYGGNVHIAYFDDVIFARALAGVSVANFYTGAVFNGADIVENPMGFSGYGAADFGVAFDVARNVNLMPFVRGGVDYANIANLSDTEFIAAIGANLLIDSVGYDLKYQYGVGVNADIRGIFNADAQMYISSPHDNFRTVLSVGAIYDESTGFGFKLGLNLGAKF